MQVYSLRNGRDIASSVRNFFETGGQFEKSNFFLLKLPYRSVFGGIVRFYFAILDYISVIYTRFPNTHEPLIDEETFALAQKRIATRHRPTKSEEIDLFSGLLFCGDCGW